MPASGQLRFLKRLILTFLNKVVYMESSNLCELPQVFFPSLQVLELNRMDNLKGWWKEVGAVAEQHLSCLTFSNLLKLSIRHCPNLTSMPLCPNVEDLTLVNVHETLSVLKTAASSALIGDAFLPSPSSYRFISKLKALCIGKVEDLISLPLECLSHISSLKIQDSELLSTCGLGEVFKSLSSLRCLEFVHCYNLRSISDGLEHLTALEKFVIFNCKELDLLSNEDQADGIPWKAFISSLRSLRVSYNPKLVALPSGLQHLTNLRSLEITFNDELMALPEWISCFRSLEYMKLEGCPKLTSLPDGFCDLTSLNELEITECLLLTLRCRGPLGEDWPKVQHIPLVCVQEM